MYDFVVVGLGAIGSFTAAELARRGHSVLGLDRYRPPHTLGSSHSETRLIREACYQGSPYMPLLRAAYERWAGLEARLPRPLMRRTGALTIGAPDSATYGGRLADVLSHDADYEALTPQQVATRFAPFRIQPAALAVLEPRAGVLALEDCLAAAMDSATGAGAELRFDESVTRWSVSRDNVSIRTEAAEYRARRLALTVGAWMNLLVPDLELPLEVERTVQYWFEPATPDVTSLFDPGCCPAWVWEYGPSKTWFGFPRTSTGIKVGMHVQAGRRTEAERVDRRVHAAEEANMRGVLERFMPDAGGDLAHASVCLYTRTPDDHFLLDRHPSCASVVLFTGGSGHAFKFAPVLGELMADLLTDTPAGLDASPFSIGRFG